MKGKCYTINSPINKSKISRIWIFHVKTKCKCAGGGSFQHSRHVSKQIKEDLWKLLARWNPLKTVRNQKCENEQFYQQTFECISCAMLYWRKTRTKTILRTDITVRLIWRKLTYFCQILSIFNSSPSGTVLCLQRPYFLVVEDLYYCVHQYSQFRSWRFLSLWVCWRVVKCRFVNPDPDWQR